MEIPIIANDLPFRLLFFLILIKDKMLNVIIPTEIMLFRKIE